MHLELNPRSGQGPRSASAAQTLRLTKGLITLVHLLRRSHDPAPPCAKRSGTCSSTRAGDRGEFARYNWLARPSPPPLQRSWTRRRLQTPPLFAPCWRRRLDDRPRPVDANPRGAHRRGRRARLLPRPVAPDRLTWPSCAATLPAVAPAWLICGRRASGNSARTPRRAERQALLLRRSEAPFTALFPRGAQGLGAPTRRRRAVLGRSVRARLRLRLGAGEPTRAQLAQCDAESGANGPATCRRHAAAFADAFAALSQQLDSAENPIAEALASTQVVRAGRTQPPA